MVDGDVLTVRLLGPLTIVGPGGEQQVRSAKVAGVLAVLALNAGRPVRTDHVADAVWGDRAPQSVHNSIQVHVHALRKAFTDAGIADARDRLRNGPWGYQLVASTDLAEFRSTLAAADVALANGQAEEALAAFDRALSLPGGAVLGGAPDTPELDAERQRLSDAVRTAEIARLRALLAAGRVEAAAQAATALTDTDPYRESVWATLMIALYRAGRTNEALRAFGRVRDLLADDLGLDPGPELTAIHAGILRQDPSLSGEPAADPVPADADQPEPPTGLPWYGDVIIGRDREADQVSTLVREADSRVVTLLGPGGAGKTRLATEVARLLSGAPFHRVIFVDLTRLTAGDDVESFVRAAVAPQGERADSDDIRMLAILDNAEHVIEAVARAVPVLLAAMPGMSILATSRIPLQIRSERRFVMPELSPQAALALFTDRARSVAPDVRFDEATTELVDRLCARLDRLPLAIELVSARLNVFGLTTLAERIDVDLLTITGPRDLPSRQRTLHETIRWSVSLLSEPAAHLLPRLSVFRGGFTLAGAAAVGGFDEPHTLGLLGELVDGNLMVRVDAAPSATPGLPARFAVRETIRLFAAAELTAAHADVEAREAQAEFVAQVFATPTGDAVSPPAAAVVLEQANFGAALDHLLSIDPRRAAALLIASARSLFLTLDHLVVDEWCERTGAAAPSGSELSMNLMAMRGVMAYSTGADDRALDLLTTVAPTLRAAPRPGYVAVTALLYHAALLVDAHDPGAWEASGATVAAVERSGDPTLAGHALNSTAYAALHLEDPATAIPMIRRCVATARTLAHPSALCHALSKLSTALLENEEADAALRPAREAVELSEKYSDPAMASSSRAALGRALSATGRFSEAVPHLAAAVLNDLTLARPPAYLAWLALSLREVDPGRAARLLGVAETLRERFAEETETLPAAMGDELRRALAGLTAEAAEGRKAEWPQVADWVTPLIGPGSVKAPHL